MSPSSRPLLGRKALIVEDDGLFALALTEMLTEFGCTIVDVAAGLTRGLASAEFHELDLAVVDVNLGEEKAFRVAHMLMAREVPFLFATGAGRDSIPSAFDDVPTLEKPFTSRELEAALLSLVGADLPCDDAREPDPARDTPRC